jgi:hypothetical protein
MLLDPSFFPYTEELLTRYADISAIAGHNRPCKHLPIAADYDFSNYFEHCGWASWLRAWSKYDHAIGRWRDTILWQDICQRVLPQNRTRWYWNRISGRVVNQRVDSWAYRFLLNIWNERGCAIIHKNNLTKTIGSFSPTVTQVVYLKDTVFPAPPVDLLLKHPEQITIDSVVDQSFEDGVRCMALAVRLGRCVRMLHRGFSHLCSCSGKRRQS